MYKKEVEGLSGPSVFIDNGDIIQGSPLSLYVLKKYGHAKKMLDVFNKLPIDAGVIGNHEFNYGTDYLQTAVDSVNYPVLSANILNTENKPAFGPPYKIMEKEGISFGILGLTTQYIPHWEHPENYKGLHFEPAVETAKKYVPKLREQVDVLIVSYHGGFEKDLVTGKETEEQTGENEGWQLLEEVSGIDVLLTGHQHNHYAQIVGNTAVLMPGHKGEFLGKVTLELEENTDGLEVRKAYPELIAVDEQTAVDKRLSKKYSTLNDEVNHWLDQSIGQVEGNMKISDSHQARIEEHPYIEFIQRVQMYFGDTDISGTALFSNRVHGFKLRVTMRDIVTNYIYPNTLSVLEVTGADLKKAIEQSAAYFTLDEKGKIVVSESYLKPKPKMYNYDMYEGIDYVIDVAQPVGHRVTLFQYKVEDIKADDLLEIVINQYRAVGGGDYPMFDGSKIIREVTVPMTELIAEYFNTFSKIEAVVNRNFKVINSNETKES